MPSEAAGLRLLLDEHYPNRLADQLCADGVDTVAVTGGRPELRGSDDRVVLEAALAEGRVVVTEDVSTFATAAALVPHHIGISYCHHERFPRTKTGLARLRAGLVALVANPPTGLGSQPITWWLDIQPDHPDDG